MRVTRVLLRNYRVFEDELELEIPPGLVGVYGLNGAGKCLPQGTRVWDGETGEGVPIERFVAERRKSMLGYTGGVVAPVTVSDWHDMGDKPTVVVRLASGAQLEVATTHPVLTPTGCVRAEDLAAGDWVAEARRLPALAPPLVTNDEALLLGMLLGDGCTTQGVRLSASDTDIVALFRQAVEATFPGCTVRSERSNHRVVSALSREERALRRSRLARRLLELGIGLAPIVGTANVPRFLRGDAGPSWEGLVALEEDYGLDLWEDRCGLHGGRAMVEWARGFGLIGCNFETKRVPPQLLLLAPDQVSHLLAGLWLTDGYVREPAGRTSAEVSYTTGSAQLADDVRVLLLRLGMTSTRTRQVVGGNTFHTIALTADACRRLGGIPLVGRKAERAKRVVERKAEVLARPLHDLIPPPFLTGLPCRSVSGRQRSTKQRARHAMSRETYLDFGGDPLVAEADVAWSQVRGVTPTGHCVPCFDVTVETDEHLYLAETFVVHNSALIESIRWTLYGRSRTAMDEVRTAGVNAECVTEVEFEHEGHLYAVRRTISGSTASAKAEAHADGKQVAEGVRDTGRYVHSILGMDDAAFRASVFAEQKQLAAFSQQTPAERRRLVLQLLGITPLDAARDLARKDARLTQDQFERLRAVLADLETVQQSAADAAKAAEEAEARSADDEALAVVARADVETAVARHVELDVLRQEHERLVAEGKEVRKQHDRALAWVAKLAQEQAELEEAASRLAALSADADGWQAAEARLRVVEAVVSAQAALDAVPVPGPLIAPDEGPAEAARAEAEAAKVAIATVTATLEAAEVERDRAREAVARSSTLTGEGDCPLCGQALGDAFQAVQAHRAAELAEVEGRLHELELDRRRAAMAADAATERASAAARELRVAQAAWADHERAVAKRQEAEAALAQAQALLGRPLEPGERAALAAEVDRRRRATDECQRIKGRLERREAVTEELDVERAAAEESRSRLETLRDKVAGLGFHPENLATALAERQRLETAAQAATTTAHASKLAAGQARERAEAEARRVVEVTEQHATLATLAEEARHLARLGELLNAFRNTLVATVGPRLSAQAAELFAELTDREYDQLEVDPDTYEIKVVDGGRTYGMSRFSGSEIDLANLALRVAVSEHVRFQSGGAVGLLVLDEVFGPLDDDRKDRMLVALERLRARFRQVLVVTHDSAIKEQLPNAIEVIKRPGRRATARVVNA